MFYSILFPGLEQREAAGQTEAPACFRDLNLGQIFSRLLKEKKEYALERFFYTSLCDQTILHYRQDVMRELENDEIRAMFTDFSRTVYALRKYMDAVRKSLASHEYWENNYLVRGRMLDYADSYCAAVSALMEGLSVRAPRSAGLQGFADYLRNYAATETYRTFRNRAAQLRGEMAGVQYCMFIKGGTIRVRRFEEQADQSRQIIELFEKFRQGDVQDYRHKLREEPYAEHVEAAVLNMVAKLYKEQFADLDDFCNQYLRFDDDTILRFSREIQFYLVWLEYIGPLRVAGLSFHYPHLCETAEHLYCRSGFDLALASILREATVPNDFELNTPERILVVTGPNQGGKTTFARAFGQIHYLASLGLCVPGKESALYLFDSILTHFGREEDLSTENGKLQDDLVRLHALFEKATSRSIIIVNEIFASTTLSDALSLGKHMMDAFAALGAPTVVVTFLDGLALHGPETVSMMSTVEPDNPAARTFKLIRKPPDGLAYALHIAGKHGLTYEQLSGRFKR